MKNGWFLICILMFIIISCDSNSESVVKDENISYSDIIDMNKEDVKSILGISTTSSWNTLGLLFDIETTDLRNNILKKDIVIEGYNAGLVVFIDDNNVYQISVVVMLFLMMDRWKPRWPASLSMWL